jgi:hypothetical protein
MRNGAATVKELTAVLPRDAGQLYFRDEIGNVSTSIVRRLRDKTEVRLQPRFPLLGGWQVGPESYKPYYMHVEGHGLHSFCKCQALPGI